jgi:hypothetical protein
VGHGQVDDPIRVWLKPAACDRYSMARNLIGFLDAFKAVSASFHPSNTRFGAAVDESAVSGVSHR